jgi:hypothetical protein
MKGVGFGFKNLARKKRGLSAFEATCYTSLNTTAGHRQAADASVAVKQPLHGARPFLQCVLPIPSVQPRPLLKPQSFANARQAATAADPHLNCVANCQFVAFIATFIPLERVSIFIMSG